ncbi:MAG: hypothetical protein BWX71_00702 [Deltaproteobacteria bacterium ADurb.Bin072]|nr:MAG: hypothetical protein BWX71_00702 [Deltaproteobacteria bacterium ADurb.Bin072]
MSYKSLLYFTYGVRQVPGDIEKLQVDEGGTAEADEMETEIKEASFTLMDFGAPGLDLTVGRQRARWGTSDEYNVIDNLNPVDFGNLYTFDPDYFVAHLPMDGFNLEYRLPTDTTLRVQAVYFFSFKPSTLPASFQARSTALMQDRLADLTEGYGFPAGTAAIVLDDPPDYSVGDGPVGLRVSGNLLNMDWGLSYYHGYVSLPVVHRIESDIGIDTGATLTSYLDYPKLDVVGFDLAGEVESVGIWAEVGCYWPEDYRVRQTTRLLTTTETKYVRLFDRPYYKYTVGFDYTFGLGNGLYWNTQFNHGYYDEFRYTAEAKEELGLGGAGFMGDLENYLASRIEYSFFNDELTAILDGLLEMPELSDISGNSAVVIKPKLIYKPYDNTSLELAYVLITGDRSTKYGAFDRKDVVYTLLKVHF